MVESSRRHIDSENSASAESVRSLRKTNNLSILQFAKAVEVSAATVESWERKGCPNRNAKTLTDSIATYIQSRGKDIELDNNVVTIGTRVYPLGFARRVLYKKSGEETIKEMAKAFGPKPDGYEQNTWKKFENNVRALPSDVMLAVNQAVLSDFERHGVITPELRQQEMEGLHAGYRNENE